MEQVYLKAAVGNKYIVTLDREVMTIPEYPHLTRLGLVERLGYCLSEGPKFGVLVKRPSGKYAQLTGANVYNLDQRSVKPMLGVGNGCGRPRTQTGGMPRTLYVRSADHIKLKEIGGTGSASAGLRKLLDIHAIMEACLTEALTTETSAATTKWLSSLLGKDGVAA